MPLNSPILILGMHRSGTSCLAGCLQEAGLFLGDVNMHAGFNKKGNRENRAIMEHHDQILRRVNASWDRPPKNDPTWTQGEKKELLALLGQYHDIGMWGVKDPRGLFMLDGWQELKPKFIGTFRHPYEVVASLLYRSRIWKQPMKVTTAYDLWATYNRKLLDLHRTQNFDIIRYDLDTEVYNSKLKRMALTLGLNSNINMKFRETALHNQRSHENCVPSDLKDIWEALNDLAT